MYNTKPERYLSLDEIKAVENIAKKHDGSPIERTFAIGDIHGIDKILMKLLKYISENCTEDMLPSRFVFVGDYIDRGKHSAKVIAIVRLLQEIMSENSVIALKGNHEQMLLEYIRGPKLKNYQYRETLASFNFKIPEDVEEWLYNLPHSCEDELHFYVHGGVNPNYSLQDQDEEEMIWIRDKFLKHKGLFEKYIIHGHTPEYLVDILENRTNIDTGAVFGNFLTAVELKHDVTKPVASYMVNEKGAHKSYESCV